MITLRKKTVVSTFSLLFALQISLILLLVVLNFSLFIVHNEFSQSQEKHFDSYLLADELRQSSDDLTRLVRAYVATGDQEFEREYWTVLDIRNGEKPRPVNYNRIYWDLVVFENQKPRPDGATISLKELMQKEGFTEAEFDKLAKAEEKSNELVKIEEEAMNAVKGLYKDEQGNFTVKGEPNLVFANKIVNDPNYYKIKEEVMLPIDEFFEMFEERTSLEVNKFSNISLALLISIIFFSILILVLSIFFFRIIKRQIVENVVLSKNLEKKVDERTNDLEKSKETLKKVLEETKKVNKFMVGREIKMMELKEKIKDLESE